MLHHLYHFYIFWGKKTSSSSTSSPFGCFRKVACSSSTLSTSDFPFHFHCYTTRDKLKLTACSLPYWPQNQLNLLIMLPKIKALLEASQQIYTKNVTNQGLFFIQRQNGHSTRENLVSRIPVYFSHYIASLTTVHWPSKGDRFSKLSLQLLSPCTQTFYPCLASLGNPTKASLGWRETRTVFS